jgi:hypothetical protein
MEKGVNRKKGQMFIVGSIIFVIGFIFLSNLFTYTEVEEKRFLESIILDRYADNIMNQYKNIIGLSSMQGNLSTINYLYNFSLFVRESSVLYVFTYFNASKYSVTIGNFLDDKINVTINASNSLPTGYQIGVMDDNTYQTVEFTATGSAELTLTYNLRGNVYNETLPATAGSNFAQGFFDITLEQDDVLIRRIGTYNMTW